MEQPIWHNLGGLPQEYVEGVMGDAELTVPRTDTRVSSDDGAANASLELGIALGDIAVEEPAPSHDPHLGLHQLRGRVPGPVSVRY